MHQSENKSFWAQINASGAGIEMLPYGFFHLLPHLLARTVLVND